MPNLSLKDLSYFGGFFCLDDLENVLKKLSLEKYKSVFGEQEVRPLGLGRVLCSRGGEQYKVSHQLDAF